MLLSSKAVEAPPHQSGVNSYCFLKIQGYNATSRLDKMQMNAFVNKDYVEHKLPRRKHGQTQLRRQHNYQKNAAVVLSFGSTRNCFVCISDVWAKIEYLTVARIEEDI